MANDIKIINCLIDEVSKRNGKIEIAIAGIEYAITQLEYLDERFPTGTTPAIISHLNYVLDKIKFSSEVGVNE